MSAHKEELVKNYGEYSTQLAQLMKEEGGLGTEQRMAIEQNLLKVQLAITESKLRSYQRKRAAL